MSSLTRELVFLILQFLDEEKFKKTVHWLERESGCFFDMKYFEDAVTNGEWDEVENYLSGFTKVDENAYSLKIFFEIRQQKYFEALDKPDYGKAVEILRNDLTFVCANDDDLHKEMTLLLRLHNFRENAKFAAYTDTNQARSNLVRELKKLIEANPLFRNKLQFPSFEKSRLRTLLNQSLNWQHQLCKNPKSDPKITTLFVDHSCGQLMGSVPEFGSFPPLGVHGPFQASPTSVTASPGGWRMANPSSMPRQEIPGGPIGLRAPNNAASMPKHPCTPITNPGKYHHTANSEHVRKRARPYRLLNEVNDRPINISPVTCPSLTNPHTSYSFDDLPRILLANLNIGSAVKSMDFHPVQQTLLLVGTNIGDIAVQEVGSRQWLACKNFNVWDSGACSMTLLASLSKKYTVSVNRVMWSPDGSLFGVAYSKHIVHIYSYHGGDDLRNHLEINAHVGSVNDLAFSCPNKKLFIITCGEDKAIKVWDAVTGANRYTLEGHEAPVYSVCPHQKENVQFIVSTSADGKIKAWLYENLGIQVNLDAPGKLCSRTASSADGTRLFSCGISKDGETYIIEWDVSEGKVKRSYVGLGKQATDVVQFDTTKNKFLVAGDEFVIKFWDVENVNFLMAIDAGGGLPASPCIRFSKAGILLAVSTSENSVKILGNAEGLRLVHTVYNRALDPSRVVTGNVAKSPIIGTYGASSLSAATNTKVLERDATVAAIVPLNGDSRTLPDVNPRITGEMEKSKVWKVEEINKQAQLHSLRLPDTLSSARITRLLYTHEGHAIFALACNGVHKVWKWRRNEQNLDGKATANALPQICHQPASGILMINDISGTKPEDAVPCFALSENDWYLVSASGGHISLFNTRSFKTMATFMPPPPAATSLALNPQDSNIIAFGMEDSSIQIYDIKADEAKIKLKGHRKRVTCLAFSNVLNSLVSLGADDQICVWSMDEWKKQANKFLQIPSGRAPNPLGQNRVQFHQDQTHLLVVHETQIAIAEAPKLEFIKQWFPRESSGSMTDATYSCDSQSVYATFEDGSISVLTAPSLSLKCRISPKAYLPASPSARVYPLVIAAHPNYPNQFALGLTDGGVHVLEPLESEGRWGTVPLDENDTGPSTNPVEPSS